CALMRPAALRLQERLQTVRLETPAIPVVHTADVCSHGDPEEIARVLSEQLFKPVRWVEVIRRLCREGVDAVVECGPGRVLAGLCKRIDPDLKTFVTDTPEHLENALAEMR
ncbi:MAG: ACP S-malonyltransferase, partial [Gammaproteobacteria bacterium]